MNTITISEFMRVFNINWSDFLWGLLWILAVLGIIQIITITTIIVMARQWFIRNELPGLHNYELQKERDKNDNLSMENSRLTEQKVTLEVEKVKLKARFLRVRENFEKGIKGE